jgi:hypothetical protein
MSLRPALMAAACAVLLGGHLQAAEQVPFRGVWAGQTVSAIPVPEAPNLVLVSSSGTGQATLLGRFTMESPHFTNLDDFSVVGSQVFTAANGDRIEAMITGVFVPTAEGDLEATLTGVITGGTGRFTGVSGSYDFLIVARPAAFGFNSTAIFSGSIVSVGSLAR